MKKYKVCSIKLDDIDLEHIDILAKRLKLKNRSEVIRKCIDLTMYQESNIEFMEDINNKLNRLLYRESITRKLVAQFFCNMGFGVNMPVKTDECYQEFLDQNNKYKDHFND